MDFVTTFLREFNDEVCTCSYFMIDHVNFEFIVWELSPHLVREDNVICIHDNVFSLLCCYCLLERSQMYKWSSMGSQS